jgi:hypothetical protein
MSVLSPKSSQERRWLLGLAASGSMTIYLMLMGIIALFIGGVLASRLWAMIAG